jgi:glycogen debranching enzyme
MRTDWDKVAADARRVLEGNRQRGISAWAGQRYDFVCPSPSTYPFQWFWDSAFHAIALLHVDPDLAKQEIRCLMQGARPDGFIPHMLLWEKSAHDAALREYAITLADPFYTATIQPPVVARAVLRIYEATGDKEFVREVLPPIRRFFRWLKAYRDPDDDSLIAIIQPDESGLDASPKYDGLMRIGPGRPEEMRPQLHRSMQRLFDAYAPHRADPARIAALDTFTWDDEAGVFWDLAGWDEEPAKVLTFSSLFPLILDDLDPAKAKRLIDEHLLSEREFWLPYPVPSVAATEPSFDPKWQTNTTWRGPTWVNVNWYLYWGLRAHGRSDVASELAERTIRMMASGGIREFYDPLTGEGEGARDFGWSTLVLDLIAAERGTV